MRISQKLEYASRAMLQLAKHADGHTITRLDEIAQREDVSLYRDSLQQQFVNWMDAWAVPAD